MTEVHHNHEHANQNAAANGAAHHNQVPEGTVETQVELTPEQKHEKIRALFDSTRDIRDFKFYFRTDDLGNKRPTVELKLPVLSVEGIVAVLEGGNEKAIALLLDAAAAVVEDQARSLVQDKEDISQDNFPMDQIDWQFIADMPRAERRGGGIGKETWDEFAKNYIAVMPNATGKTPEQVALAAKLLLGKFNAVKTNKPVIKALQAQLGIYTTVSPNAEAYTACVEFLNNKATALLEADEAALLEML